MTTAHNPHLADKLQWARHLTNKGIYTLASYSYCIGLVNGLLMGNAIEFWQYEGAMNEFNYLFNLSKGVK